jgi:hypothetical protein
MVTPADSGKLHVVAEPTTRLYPGDLIAEVAQRSGMPVAIVNPVVRAFISAVSDSLATGHDCVLS